MDQKPENSMATHTGANESTPVAVSAFFLIAANLVPLFGAIFWGWKVFDIVVLYWLENVLVGVINAFRMLIIREKNDGPAAIVGKVFQTGFFCFHYGLFTLVHGVFVFALLGGSFGAAKTEVEPSDLVSKLMWAFLALIVSHLISFFFNFIGKREFEKRTLEEQMMAPYPRMLALHMAIVFGAFAVQSLGQPVVLLAILVIGKTAADWKLHIHSHRKAGKKKSNYPKLP